MKSYSNRTERENAALPPAFRRTAGFKDKRYAHTIGLTTEQRELVTALTQGHGFSLSELVDSAIGFYIDGHYASGWPAANRQWRNGLSKPRVPTQRGNLWVYGVLFNRDQDIALQSVLDQHGAPHGGFAALVELAMREYVPGCYHIPWPPMHRMAEHFLTIDKSPGAVPEL